MSEAPAPRIGLIWAQAENGVIGMDGVMPWHLPGDLAHFKRITLGAPVIMGRRTWDSLPARFRPLPGRANIVVTRNSEWAAEGALVADSPAAALILASAPEHEAPEWVWVMGGGELYRQTLPLADRLEITRIAAEITGDTRAPELGPEWVEVPGADDSPRFDAASGLSYRFVRYERG
ncbi:dihydrofolate reductase [Leucobacter luti]|uniref:dihydrofolate reductase n=1 Tax=Leucobacter luti TaxID=340320 RepID=UPI0037BE979B